jgi:putative tricarboxylic transport membrane protein
MIERFVNLFWITLGFGAAVMALQMKLTGPYGPDSGLFPFIAGAMVGLGGLTLMFARSHAVAAIEWPSRTGFWRVGGVISGMAVLVLLLPYVGFGLSSFVTMIILIRFVERVGWLQSIALSLASVAGVIVLFGHLLEMPLPRGPWGF